MKNFAKLFVVALVVALVAALFAVSASAATTGGLIDPRTLKPTSDKVYFVMDTPEGGELPGDGSGSDAQNPLQPEDHESFDPDAEYPRMYFQTALYQATEALAKTGGTIVVCGPTFIGIDQSYGSGATTRDFFFAQNKDKTIKITSVYNGVDYRETNGAKITIDNPAEIGTYGQTIWENIDIETVATNRVISFNGWATLIGEGVNCYPQDELFEGIAPNYISISGGHRYAGGVDKTTNVVIQSGSYNIVASGIWGVNNTRKFDDDGNITSTNNLDGATVANLTLEGQTTVYGQVIGTCRQNSEFSGVTNITINGGRYECDINGVGASGMVNDDGMVVLKITGGDFSSCYSINDAHDGHTNNPPAHSVLDFSGWKGEMNSLVSAFSVVTVFKNIKLPDGVTEDQLIELANQGGGQTTAPLYDETEPPVDNDGGDAAPDDSEAEGEENAPGDKVAVDGAQGGISIGLLLGIVGGVVAVAVIAIVVVIVVFKKKAKKE